MLERSFTFFLVLLLTACAAKNKDFRALDFGEDCKSVDIYEQAQGSMTLDEPYGMPTYLNEVFGKPAVISYICSAFDGKLIGAGMYFSFHSLDEASQYYDELFGQLQDLYGEPVISNDKLEEGGPGARWEHENISIVTGISEPSAFGNRKGADVSISYLPLPD